MWQDLIFKEMPQYKGYGGTLAYQELDPISALFKTPGWECFVSLAKFQYEQLLRRLGLWKEGQDYNQWGNVMKDLVTINLWYKEHTCVSVSYSWTFAAPVALIVLVQDVLW